MGKATGIASQFRGKVGNVIGYLTRNRLGRYEQSVKAYQPVVANPQTWAQALARIPLGPTQRFYNVLAALIQRGFEGTAYGDPSKAAFLSYNLKYFQGPFLTKEDLQPYPGPFLMAKGSLRSLDCDHFDAYGYKPAAFFAANLPDELEENTIGRLSQLLLEANTWLKYGDQLTFVMAVNVSGQIVYMWRSFFIDPRSIEVTLDFDATNDEGVIYLVFQPAELRESDKVLAACCIRSQAFGDTGFRRSTTFLKLNPAERQFNTEEDIKAAALSYRDNADEDEDWETDPTPIYQRVAYLCLVTITEDMVNFSSFSALQGTQCLGYVTKGGEVGIFYFIAPDKQNMCLLDGYAKPLYHSNGTQNELVRYNLNYQPALYYDASYGTLY